MNFNIRYSIVILGIAVLLHSCEDIDNFEEPNTILTGHVSYQGDSIYLGNNEVEFELWQSGFGKLVPIAVRLDQHGAYSARLFDGQYKLVFVGGQGPFRTNVINQQQRDTIFVDLKGDQQETIEVIPYFMVRNASFQHTASTISGNCTVEQIITDVDPKTVERVTLYVNETVFVSDNGDYNDARADADISDLSNLSMSVDLPESLMAKPYVFARIGVKIGGVEDMIYSKVEKIKL